MSATHYTHDTVNARLEKELATMNRVPMTYRVLGLAILSLSLALVILG